MTCTHPSLQAHGSSITCKHCLGLVMVWSHIRPYRSRAKLHSLNADTLAIVRALPVVQVRRSNEVN